MTIGMDLSAPENHFLSWHCEMYYHIPQVMMLYYRATPTNHSRFVTRTKIWNLKFVRLENKTEHYSYLDYYSFYSLAYRGIDYSHALKAVNEHVVLTIFTSKIKTSTYYWLLSSGIISQAIQRVQLYPCKAIQHIKFVTKLEQIHLDVFWATHMLSFFANDSCAIIAHQDQQDGHFKERVIPVVIYNMPSSISKLITNVENKPPSDFAYRFHFKSQIMWAGTLFSFSKSRYIGSQYFPEVYYVLQLEGSVLKRCLVAQLVYGHAKGNSHHIYAQDFPLSLPIFPYTDQCQPNQRTLFVTSINTTRFTANNDCNCNHCYIRLYTKFHNISKKENNLSTRRYVLAKLFENNVSVVTLKPRIQSYNKNHYFSAMGMK